MCLLSKLILYIVKYQLKWPLSLLLILRSSLLKCRKSAYNKQCYSDGSRMYIFRLRQNSNNLIQKFLLLLTKQSTFHSFQFRFHFIPGFPVLECLLKFSHPKRFCKQKLFLGRRQFGFLMAALCPQEVILSDDFFCLVAILWSFLKNLAIYRLHAFNRCCGIVTDTRRLVSTD